MPGGLQVGLRREQGHLFVMIWNILLTTRFASQQDLLLNSLHHRNMSCILSCHGANGLFRVMEKPKLVYESVKNIPLA